MNEFVNYLNGLHNYYAQNQNAYGERNIESPFYMKTMVAIDICDYIISSIESNEPHIIILTGHAGDGKTSLMYQVLGKLGIETLNMDSIQKVVVEENKRLYCIKDFSELSDEKKKKTLSKVVQYPSTGNYVFMVANTGPLINTFGELFSDRNEKEEAKMALIEAMDSNDGEIKDLFGYKIMVINIALIENSQFARKFLKKILADDLWESCGECPNHNNCHIYTNRNLIFENIDRVQEFIEYYYIWQAEYGSRLTIRSITEQLAYMITGGDSCNDIKPSIIHEKMFFNLFFGFEGVIPNPIADNIVAVKIAKQSNIYLRRLRADEDLLIRRNYHQLFGNTVNKIIDSIDIITKLHKGFDDELHRMYLFLNILSGENHKRDLEDIFSKQFIPYLTVRNTGIKPTKSQKSLVIDALRMIYIGTVISKNNMIPITMGTDGGITQSVQLIAGQLNTSDIELVAADDAKLNKARKNVILKIKKKRICTLTLPMIDHFEELKNGVIATNMDPQLSRGIENLKARLLELADTDEDRLDFLVMDNKGFSEESIIIEDGIVTLQ